MREILFRGKHMHVCTENKHLDGTWVEGYLADENHINDGKCEFLIDPETICQYTGLTDKNGKKIWENDIVEFEDCGEEGYEYKEGFDFENRARVEFTEGRWSLTDFVGDNSAVIDEMYDHAEFMNLWGECEVIGNIFDNPELLEV
nr:MAG TPA: YopX protein [Caudoviricetes sp.]